MSAFQQREGDFAVTVSNGVYKQVDVFEREGRLYVREGSGFVTIQQDGSTSKSKLRLDHLNTDTPLATNATGRLCIAGDPRVPNQKPLRDGLASRLGLPDTRAKLGC